MYKPKKIKKDKKGKKPGVVNGMKKFWASMTPAKKKKFCAERGKSLKKTLSEKTPEERSARMDKANVVYKKIMATPEGKAKQKSIALKNLSKVNNPVVKDLPRVNDYAGVITSSEYESL